MVPVLTPVPRKKIHFDYENGTRKSAAKYFLGCGTSLPLDILNIHEVNLAEEFNSFDST